MIRRRNENQVERTKTSKTKLGGYGLTPLVYALFFCLTWLNALWVLKDDDLRDFGSFVAAGRAANDGRDPYATAEPLVFHVKFDDVGVASRSPNLNPPISVPLLGFLDRLIGEGEIRLAMQIWRVLSLLLYLASVSLLMRFAPDRPTPIRFLWALSLAGFWHMLEVNQVYAPLVLITTFAWILLNRRRGVWAGIFVGFLVAMKPNFGLWPVMLILGGHLSVGVAAITTAGTLSLIPAALYGPHIYVRWLEASRAFEGLAFPGNVSLLGLTVRFGVPLAGSFLSLLLVLFLFLFIRRHRPDVLVISGLALVTSLLASPIAWVGYTLFLVPPLLWFDWDAATTAAGCLLAIPFWVMLMLFEVSFFWFVTAGWFHGLALLLFLWSMLRRVSVPAGTTAALSRSRKGFHSSLEV